MEGKGRDDMLKNRTPSSRSRPMLRIDALFCPVDEVAVPYPMPTNICKASTCHKEKVRTGREAAIITVLAMGEGVETVPKLAKSVLFFIVPCY